MKDFQSELELINYLNNELELKGCSLYEFNNYGIQKLKQLFDNESITLLEHTVYDIIENINWKVLLKIKYKNFTIYCINLRYNDEIISINNIQFISETLFRIKLKYYLKNIDELYLEKCKDVKNNINNLLVNM